MRRTTCATLLVAALIPGFAAAVPTCSIDSVVDVAFGGYDVFDAAPVDTSGTVTYTCSGAISTDVVAIELSQGGAGSFFPRALANGAYSLEYNLFLDAARTEVWGDGTNGSSRYTLTGTANNATVSVTVYGRIPALQNVAVGNYSDTITVTLQY